MLKKLTLFLLRSPGLLAMIEVKGSALEKFELNDVIVEVPLNELSGIIQESHRFVRGMKIRLVMFM